MPKLALPLRWFPLLLALAAAPALAQPEPVRGVLFHAPDCAECGEVFDFLLPALREGGPNDLWTTGPESMPERE